MIAPLTVNIPAGPTGMDPSQTSFFQTLNIATKINKGSIEILNDVEVVTKGTKVRRSLTLTPRFLSSSPVLSHCYRRAEHHPCRERLRRPFPHRPRADTRLPRPAARPMNELLTHKSNRRGCCMDVYRWAPPKRCFSASWASAPSRTVWCSSRYALSLAPHLCGALPNELAVARDLAAAAVIPPSRSRPPHPPATSVGSCLHHTHPPQRCKPSSVSNYDPSAPTLFA